MGGRHAATAFGSLPDRISFFFKRPWVGKMLAQKHPVRGCDFLASIRSVALKDVKILTSETLGRNFIPSQYLPPGTDEFCHRNEQSSKQPGQWRHLRADEIEVLVKNAVTCHDWDNLFVTDPFTPQLIKNTEFFGMVRIGRLERVILEHHELKIRAGISDSMIISCDLGDNVAIHNVRYMAHFIIGDHVMLLNVDEMNTTNHAKFGNGIVKEGESEDVRVWIHPMNETGGRPVMPFDGMLAADAYLWAKYRDDSVLMTRLGEITQRQFDPRRGFYGTVGDACVIKNCQILKDVKIGPCSYIKGANKLKNLTINSSPDEPTQIGEGVELVNGIVGLGCHVFYGCKAVRFVMGNNSNLKYGARLINSYLGDNSTVSCCELLNNLVFPAHEQHHNNSFLVAALVMGQSNIAAGATLGSNHNSRANDGELQAGRGFWPGLCTTIKHSCRFASFSLLAKGDYPAELDLQLPFALLSDDPAHNRLRLMPAYWWLYDMYALARNTWKFLTRDTRKTKSQHIEFDSLAPDTIEEIFHARSLLERWTAQAHLRAQGKPLDDQSPESLERLGRDLLQGPEELTAGLEILGENVEDSNRKVVLLKAREGYHAYGQMLHYYAMKNLLAYLTDNPHADLAAMSQRLAGPRQREWVNMGGQLIAADDVQRLIEGIQSGELDTWPKIHADYDRLWQAYPLKKRRHAYATLLTILKVPQMSLDNWHAALDEAVRIQEHVCEQVYRSRKKDYEDPFRQTTYRNAAEMAAVVGTAENNSFVKQVARETEAFRTFVESVKSRG
jgi:hypothetical protein